MLFYLFFFCFENLKLELKNKVFCYLKFLKTKNDDENEIKTFMALIAVVVMSFPLVL